MKKRLLCVFAVFIFVFNFAACGSGNLPETDKSEYTEIGEGARSFYLDIFFEEHEKHYKINTGETNIGPALKALGIVDGKNGEYGLFIESVEGEKHVYDEGGKYWAFYENGQLAVKSVDQTEIRNGTVYALRVE